MPHDHEYLHTSYIKSKIAKAEDFDFLSRMCGKTIFQYNNFHCNYPPTKTMKISEHCMFDVKRRSAVWSNIVLMWNFIVTQPTLRVVDIEWETRCIRSEINVYLKGKSTYSETILFYEVPQGSFVSTWIKFLFLLYYLSRMGNRLQS